MALVARDFKRLILSLVDGLDLYKNKNQCKNMGLDHPKSGESGYRQPI